MNPKENAHVLSEILVAGKSLGLIENHCPLCNASHTASSFDAGIKISRNMLLKLDEVAESTVKKKTLLDSELRLVRDNKDKARLELVDIVQRIEKLETSLNDLNALRATLQYDDNVSPSVITERIISEQDLLFKLENTLRILETLTFNSLLESSHRERREADEQVTEFERLLAISRKGESRAKSLYDATRRAVNEALDDRFDLIDPLLGDLYRRLRPHNSWRDID